MRALVLLLAMLHCVHLGAQNTPSRILSEVDDGTAVNLLVTVGGAASSYTAMRQVALQYLQKYRETRKLVDVVIAPDAESALRAVGRDRVHGLGYATAVEDLKSTGLSIGPVGRLFALSGSAKFVYRDRDDIRSDLPVGTLDPSIITIDGFRCEILHTRLTQARGSSTENSVYSLNVFVKASPMFAPKATAEIVRRAETWTKSSTIFITIRPDVWFFDDFRYPEILPWVKTGTWPARDEYERVDETRCVGQLGKITCNGETIKR